MSSMFENYPELTSEISNNSIEQSTSNDTIELLKETCKQLKKENKRLKKKNKQLKKLTKFYESNDTEKVFNDKKSNKTKKDNSFLDKLSDTFIKNLPSLLKTAVTKTINVFFKYKFRTLGNGVLA